jgi:hypothetical protein
MGVRSCLEGGEKAQIFILDYSGENNGFRLSIAPCPNANVQA